MKIIKFNKNCKLYGHIEDAVNLYKSGESINTIARLYKMHTAGVSRAFKKLGIKTRSMSEAILLAHKTGRRKYRRGKAHSSWINGKTLHESGYVKVKMPKHHRAHKHTGYVFEHIVIAEIKIGRVLVRSEIVHHINGIKNDNRPENLIVMSRSEHMRYHSAERRKKSQATITFFPY